MGSLGVSEPLLLDVLLVMDIEVEELIELAQQEQLIKLFLEEEFEGSGLGGTSSSPMSHHLGPVPVSCPPFPQY